MFAVSVSAPSWQISPLLLYLLLFYFKLSVLISSDCLSPVPGEQLLPALIHSVLYFLLPKASGMLRDVKPGILQPKSSEPFADDVAMA